ncbi:MAG TPA: bacillithiol biosynthesis BshC, partial [Thermoanaerobaculia bacterium]|nr:bacillithiol biosynthesis BshC [Thermoanaerobaculia bacterium]
MNESGCIRFPLSAYPGMNPFVLDWMAGEKRATNFLPRETNVGRASARPARAEARPTSELVDALDRSNRHWGNFVSDDLQRWAAGETMTLIAGQQVGFAGGPLYTLAKIATLIKMKRQLAAQGKDATIFFWLATEDHDYAEAATLSLPVSSVPATKSNVNRQLDLVTLRAARAVESREMVGPAPVPEALIAQLLSLYDIERPPWLRAGISFRDSFAELLISVFEGERIVFVDALLPELRRAGAPLFEKMFAQWDAIEEEIASRSDALARAEYVPQVVTRPGEQYTLLFQINEHGERHIVTGRVDDPTTISTSALTRPLLQDFVFAPDVFVGGPSEVAYYAQIASLHELLGIPMPRVALRGHALVAPKRIARLFERFGLEAREIFMPADAILAEREAPGVAEVHEIAERAHANLAAEITRIGEIALPAEHALARAINRSIGHIEYHFDKLAERAIRGLVRKEKERWTALRELVATFHPDGHVQDR